MDTNWIPILNLVFTFGIAVAYAYQAKQNKDTQRLVLENNQLTIASKAVSETNSRAISGVALQGFENAEAIEHGRIQNVKLASAVETTKVQNDELAESVGHLHTCVETKVAEVKEAVERLPEAVKEIVPAAIKEVVPDVIKEAVPAAIAALDK